MRNELQTQIEATLDLGASENLQYSSKGPLVRKNLRVGEMQFMMHAQAGLGQFEKVLKHSAKDTGKK